MTTSALTPAGFTQGNLFRHVSVMSLTSSIGLMAIFLVDLLDVLFISMPGEASLAAAAGYAGTVMFFASAINIGLSIAAGALVGRALGQGDQRRAQDYATVVALLAGPVGVIVPVVILSGADGILEFLGARGEVRHLAMTYLAIILPATVLSGLSMVGVATLRSGRALVGSAWGPDRTGCRRDFHSRPRPGPQRAGP